MNLVNEIKYIEFHNQYQNEINDFINKSMYQFIHRPYKIREDVANIEKHYIKSGGNFWLAINQKNNHIIGSIGLEKINNNIGILRRFYIQEEYQNQKVGSNLYKILEKYSRKNNINTLYLTCGKILEKAHKFYTKNGWIQLDKIEINMHVSETDDLFKKIL